MDSSATWTLKSLLCLAAIAVFTSSSPQTANAQPTTCEDLCGLAPVVSLEQATCVGVTLQATGYPIYTTPICAGAEGTADCLACYHAINVADAHCVMAFDACIGGLAPQQTGEVVVVPAPRADPVVVPAQPGMPVVAAPLAVHACAPNENCACPGSHSCSLDCPSGGCNLSCGAGASCTLSCAGGNCDMSCGSGSNCTLYCPGGNCDTSCASGAACTLNCPGGNCDISCASGAACAVECPVNCDCNGPGC